MFGWSNFKGTGMNNANPKPITIRLTCNVMHEDAWHVLMQNMSQTGFPLVVFS